MKQNANWSYENQHKKPNKLGFAIVVLSILILIWSCVYECNSPKLFRKNIGNQQNNITSSPSIDFEDISNDEVYATAEVIMRNRLLSPSSADFPSQGSVSKRSDGIYVVMSYVDAQNAYGAKLRQYWICQLKYKGGSWDSPDSWQIIEATFM